MTMYHSIKYSDSDNCKGDVEDNGDASWITQMYTYDATGRLCFVCRYVCLYKYITLNMLYTTLLIYGYMRHTAPCWV